MILFKSLFGHYFVPALTNVRSSNIWIWPLKVVVVDEGVEPTRSTGERIVPRIVEALEAHFQCLEPPRLYSG